MWEPKKVTVIGAGTMGHGIAQVSAQGGLETVLHDLYPEALERAMNTIRENLARGVAKGKVTAEEEEAALARIHLEPDLDRAVEEASLVVEAAPEDLELKKELFRGLGSLPFGTVLATNTSALPVGEIAEASASPHRVVGMHFFNPVHVMSLLEVVRAEATSAETVDRALEFGSRVGKECIVVQDTPGFATSRLGVVLGLEAIRMLEEGVASAEDIDRAMTLGYRHPVGPLRLTDMVGLDVRLQIAEHLHRALQSDAFRPPDILRRMVAEGNLGKKSGRGFYTWS